MDDKQNINTNAPNINSDHVKEEFYRWFHSRGVLTELRACMRQLMAKAMEEGQQDGQPNSQIRSSTSPKLQAINLLLVDYLFHEDYFYTVSVFASEAHILNSLPQYSRYVTESVKEQKWNPSSLPRFSRQESEDILDTLHLPPTHSQQQQATNTYLDGHESLLMCIVRTMVPTREQILNADHDVMSAGSTSMNCEECSYPLWSKEIQELLLMAGIKLVHIQRMKLKWAQIVEEERRKAREEAEEEFAARETEWQQQVEERLTEARLVLRERQSRVEVREQSLSALADQLTLVHEDVTNRLSQLQLRSKQLDEIAAQQESERLYIQQKLKQFETREDNQVHSLSRFPEQMSRERFEEINEDTSVKVISKRNSSKDVCVQVTSDDQIEEEKENMGVPVSTQTVQSAISISTQTLDLVMTDSTQTVEMVDHDQQTCDTQPDQQLIHQLEQTRTKVSELQEENMELRAHILQQRHRIDELTNRAAGLSSQLEESQMAVAVLSGRQSAVVAASTSNPPPPPPVFIAPTFGYSSPQRQGGGEESLFVPRPQQATPRPDGRKRALRFAFSQNPSPTSEESSPTDEVVQNARSRIQQLEQESIAIQRNYQNFQARLLTTDSVMFPPLPPVRTNDPLTRVRRTEVASSLPSHVPYSPTSFGNYRNPFINYHQSHYDEDSSSEFYDRIRIDSLTSSRRIFNQRNIRQFERWKQFKKKFQKRETIDQNRRNQKTLNSNTSSEDDDGDFRNRIRRQEANNIRSNMENQGTSSGIPQSSQFVNEDKQSKKLTKQQNNKGNRENNREVVTIPGKNEEPKETSNSPHVIAEKVSRSKENVAVPGSSKTEENIVLDLEHSKTLIESVKILLEAQNIRDTPASTSNGTTALESLPRDSDNSHLDIDKTDSSIVTVQNKDTAIQREPDVARTDDKEKESEYMILNNATDLKIFNKNTTNFTSPICGEGSINLEKNIDEEKDDNAEERNPDTLINQTHILNFSEMNFSSEAFASNIAITSSDVAEVESGDQATTSMTSGSDILRELNPSKTDSSSSVISAGFGEDSKHSSDFWD